jgi:hypothetical protein
MRLPRGAAWRHIGAREGFETAFVRVYGSGYQFDGFTAAVEDREVWAVRYSITVDAAWRTRGVRMWRRNVAGERETTLDSDGEGRWVTDGSRAAQLDGCLDVDLETSACTNTLPVRRLGLQVGESAEVPAVYLRALDLDVERLEQVYTRVDAHEDGQCYDYEAPTFGFNARLTFDRAGLVLDYPGIAERVA